MKLKKGDIFKINISNSSCAFGQIIDLDKNGISVMIFEGLYNPDTIPDVADLVSSEILFLANTFDAKFYHKHWIVIDNHTNNLNNLKLPIYKLGTDDSLRYEDFFMKPISEEHISFDKRSKITYRKFIAPVGIELALKDYYKIANWDEGYDGLLYCNMVLR